jgi:hypothetical protein
MTTTAGQKPSSVVFKFIPVEAVPYSKLPDANRMPRLALGRVEARLVIEIEGDTTHWQAACPVLNEEHATHDGVVADDLTQEAPVDRRHDHEVICWVCVVSKDPTQPQAQKVVPQMTGKKAAKCCC